MARWPRFLGGVDDEASKRERGEQAFQRLKAAILEPEQNGLSARKLQHLIDDLYMEPVRADNTARQIDTLFLFTIQKLGTSDTLPWPDYHRDIAKLLLEKGANPDVDHTIKGWGKPLPVVTWAGLEREYALRFLGELGLNLDNPVGGLIHMMSLHLGGASSLQFMQEWGADASTQPGTNNNISILKVYEEDAKLALIFLLKMGADALEEDPQTKQRALDVLCDKPGYAKIAHELRGCVQGFRNAWEAKVEFIHAGQQEKLAWGNAMVQRKDGKWRMRDDYRAFLSCGCDVFDPPLWENPQRDLPRVIEALPPYWQQHRFTHFLYSKLERGHAEKESPLRSWRAYAERGQGVER